MSNESQLPARSDAIDAAKGIAILCVVLIHSQLFFPGTIHQHVINRAVPVFLVLFGITSAHWWDKTPPNGRVRHWYGTRLRRLFPPYWTAILIWWAVQRLAARKPYGWDALLIGLTGYLPCPELGMTWFLTAILQLVLLYPILQLLTRVVGLATCLAVSIVILVFSHIYSLEIMSAVLRHLPLRDLVNPFYAFAIFVPQHFLLLFAGLLIVKCDWDKRLRAVLTAAVVCLAGLVLQHIFLPPSALNRVVAALTDIPLTICILAGAAFAVAIPTVGRALIWCGTWSWDLFLGQTVTYGLAYSAYVHRGGPDENRLAWTFVLLLGSCSFALARQRWRPSPVRIATVGIGIATGLLVAEVGVRLAGLDSRWPELALLGSRAPTSRYDPRLGWMNLPSSAGVLSWPDSDRSMRLTTNRQGFRFPRDFQIERTRPHRLAIVGDSQVFGFVVGDDEHLGAILDRELSDVETYPFGVPGYGPTQEMLILDEHVLPYRPDLVIAVLFLENDLNDETMSVAYGWLAKPYLTRVDGVWHTENIPVPLQLPGARQDARAYLRPFAAPFRLSALYRLLVSRASGSPGIAAACDRIGAARIESVPVPAANDPYLPVGFRRIDEQEPVCNTTSRCPQQHWLDGLPATIEAYRRMQLSSAKRGARFLALVTPSVAETRAGSYAITNAAVRGLSAVGVETISLVEAFSADGSPSRFIAKDLHWNPAGTRRAAEVVREWVNRALDEDTATVTAK